MKDIRFSFCSFQENLINKVLVEQPFDEAVFIFPTEVSKRIALSEFQKHWAFNQTLFLSMEEMKELLFISDNPLLKEEKRTLAFYASLTEKDKEFFRINNYFQSIELAQHFFDLWEEFNDELVNEHINKEKFEIYNTELLGWQKKTFDKLKSIKKNYKNFLKRKGFEDVIFVYKPWQINFQYFSEFSRFVIVNQFYYTNLEKYIIQKIAESGNSVTIYYQLPETIVDKTNLKIAPFSLNDLIQDRTESINIFESKNDFSMITCLLEQINQDKVDHIIDVSFWQNPYSKFLSYQKFGLSNKLSFTNTSIYKFFKTTFNLLNSLTWEPNQKNMLLPIQAILDAVLVDDFFFYFITDPKKREKKIIQEHVLNYLYSLIEYDYKYIDMNEAFFRLIPNKSESRIVRFIIRFLNKIISIQNINDFVAFVDFSPDGIIINRIITSREKNYSDIRELFYQTFSDFSSIEQLNFVEDWGSYFSSKDQELKQVNITSGILKLFINYMKFRSIRLSYGQVNSKRVGITNLEDTRNIQYEKIAVLNLIEGKIPAARQIPFLFTEKQRKIMNLKTYEEIKLREKYYFFRLVLNARNVSLYTQKNIEQNIDSSSFLEEIKLFFPSTKIKNTEIKDKYYSDVYRQFLTSKDYHVSKEITKSPDFFHIHLNLNRDFPDGNLNLSHYSLKLLQENPFVYYIRDIGGVEEKSKKVGTDFSAKLIGVIVHDIINEAWKQIIEDHYGPLFGYDFSLIDNKFIDQSIYKILNQDNYYYRIPHNYTAIYFNEIVLPFIHQGVKNFFKFLDGLSNKNKNIVVIPEKEYSSLEERKYKMYISQLENELRLNVRLRGRADLRIELPDENQYIIFDYKTGGYDKTQLIIYELFYYLLQKPELIEKVKSYFFQVLKGENKELKEFFKSRSNKVASKEEIFISFKEDILETIEHIAEHGFTLPDLRSRLNAMTEITRKDLFLA